ncbi:hypothetical protein GCM10027027_03370 [Neomicrococcus lactis]
MGDRDIRQSRNLSEVWGGATKLRATVRLSIFVHRPGRCQIGAQNVNKQKHTGLRYKGERSRIFDGEITLVQTSGELQ